MALNLAVTCSRTGCLAVYLTKKRGTTPNMLAHEIREFGWGGTEDDLCPSCATGRGPVLERGECTTCMGRTVWRDDTLMRCTSCRTDYPVTPEDDDLPENTP